MAKAKNKKREQDQKTLAGYEILLAVTGGVACYKVVDLASKLVQSGAGVNVAMSESAVQFVAPLSFQSISRRQVFTSMWQSVETYDPKHVSLTRQADLAIVAPATANILGKMAGGIANDLISTMLLATTGSCEVLVAPAMNTHMWQAPAVQANVERLKGWGVHFIGPAEGYLACGDEGPGRMAEPAKILSAVQKLLLRNPPKNPRA